MEIIEAYKLYSSRLKDTSPEYNKITNDSDSVMLSALYVIKAYKDYIVCLASNNKSPRLSTLGDLNTHEYKKLSVLLESFVTMIDAFCLEPKNILIEDSNIEDPLNLIDIIFRDNLSVTLSDDSIYEGVLKSLLNVLIENNFEKVLKGVLLKFTHSKIKDK